MKLDLILANISQISSLILLIVALTSLSQNIRNKFIIVFIGGIFAIAGYLFIPNSIRSLAAVFFSYFGLLILAKTPITKFIKKLPARALKNAIIAEFILISAVFLIVLFAYENTLLAIPVIALLPVSQALIYAYLHGQIIKLNGQSGQV